jgi:hypothetical protein
MQLFLGTLFAAFVGLAAERHNALIYRLYLEAIFLAFNTLLVLMLFSFISLLKIFIGEIDRIEQLIHWLVTSLPLLRVVVTIILLFEDVCYFNIL